MNVIVMDALGRKFTYPSRIVAALCRYQTDSDGRPLPEFSDEQRQRIAVQLALLQAERCQGASVQAFAAWARGWLADGGKVPDPWEWKVSFTGGYFPSAASAALAAAAYPWLIAKATHEVVRWALFGREIIRGCAIPLLSVEEVERIAGAI